MKRAGIFVLFVLISATAIPCFGQQPGQPSTSPTTRGCDLTGTWYGGSDMTVPYQFTAEPIDGTRYTVRFQQPLDVTFFPTVGLLGWTDWTGVATKGPGQKYDVLVVVFYTLPPDSGQSPEMDGVHSIIEFTPDCNMIQNTIDTYFAFLPWTEEKVPFVTEPDVNVLEVIGIETLLETYHRMPTVCPNCPFAGTGNSALGLDALKLHGKKR